MDYTINLTPQEIVTLLRAKNRGHFPAETFDAMHSFDEITWIIPEHAATALREAHLPHLSGPLLEKLLTLKNSIQI